MQSGLSPAWLSGDQLQVVEWCDNFFAESPKADSRMEGYKFAWKVFHRHGWHLHQVQTWHVHMCVCIHRYIWKEAYIHSYVQRAGAWLQAISRSHFIQGEQLNGPALDKLVLSSPVLPHVMLEGIKTWSVAHGFVIWTS